MAFVVGRKDGRYEIRQSSATPRGPRSTVLATFRVLSDDVLGHAEQRAGRPLDRPALRQRARKAGAPVAEPAPDSHAGLLLGELARGAHPTPVRARLVAHALATDEVAAPADHLRAAGEWAGADHARRGEALVDLLGLVDAIPVPGRSGHPSYPPLRRSARG